MQCSQNPGPRLCGRCSRLAALKRLCAEKGLRVTEQRRIIMQVIAGAHDYPDIEELHRRAVGDDPRIALATIYRNVRLFQELGILERHEFLNGPARYEASPSEHHDHLIDVRSGRVIEFRSPEIERSRPRSLGTTDTASSIIAWSSTWCLVQEATRAAECFLEAPFIETLRGNKPLAGALSAITAAVVGVVLPRLLPELPAGIHHQGGSADLTDIASPYLERSSVPLSVSPTLLAAS